jgi:hypothetical protein
MRRRRSGGFTVAGAYLTERLPTLNLTNKGIFKERRMTWIRKR